MAYADPSHLFFSPDDWGEIFSRIGLALLAGGAVGINRDRIKRPAGLRTYMTVSVGSAFFVILILQAGVDFNATNALSRTVQGITPIKGLTSAAGLWQMTLVGTVMALVILSGFKQVKDGSVYKKVVRRKRLSTPPVAKAGGDQSLLPWCH
jgi:putative Mg2+ transporter-C (MgtC) family protein